jgi:hypothetical protein
MPRRAATALVIAVLVLAGVIAMLIAGAGESSRTVISEGVSPVYPVVPIPVGSVACQTPFGPTESFDSIHFNVGAFGKPGPGLAVSVVDEGSGAELGWAHVRPGWVDNGSAKDLDVGRIAPGSEIGICIRNEGPVRAYVYGDYYHGAFGKGPLGVTPTNSTNAAEVDGMPLEGDMALQLRTDKPRSVLSRAPALFDHLGTFKPPFVGPWTFWLLAVLVLVGAPLALWAALSRAGDGDGSPASRRYPDSP